MKEINEFRPLLKSENYPSTPLINRTSKEVDNCVTAGTKYTVIASVGPAFVIPPIVQTFIPTASMGAVVGAAVAGVSGVVACGIGITFFCVQKMKNKEKMLKDGKSINNDPPNSLVMKS